MNDREAAAKLQRLQSTDDHAERNALAVELSDARDPRLFDLLVALIKKPELENNRGTLLYCLEKYDCKPITGLLLQLSKTGNFEVRTEADIILDEQGLR